MKKNGYAIYELIILIIIMGVATVFTISKVSYALEDDASDEAYNIVVNYIETQARNYGNTIIEEIKTEDKIITVNTLISEGYIDVDTDGLLYDPRDNSLALNEYKIRLKYNEETQSLTAEILDE